MSIPALRQPKIVKKPVTIKPPSNVASETKDFLIVTLREGKKLVVLSDAYHGVLTVGELYKCVFCEKEMLRDMLCKESHKNSQNHRKIMEAYPHVEDFKENLIRKLTSSTYYCTICNITVLSQFLHKHLTAENHVEELKKAIIRGQTYTPTRPTKEEFPPLRKK